MTNNTKTKQESKPKIELVRVESVADVTQIMIGDRSIPTVNVSVYTIDSEGKQQKETIMIKTTSPIFAETMALYKTLNRKQLSEELVIFSKTDIVADLINSRRGYGKAFNNFYAVLYRNKVEPTAYHDEMTKKELI